MSSRPFPSSTPSKPQKDNNNNNNNKQQSKPERNITFENAAGHVMIAMYQLSRIREKLEAKLSTEPAISQFSYKHGEKYYNVSTRVTQSEEPLFTTKNYNNSSSLHDERKLEFENLLGNMLIAEYQVAILQGRLYRIRYSYRGPSFARPISTDDATSSQFIFDVDNNWMRVSLMLDKEKMPPIPEGVKKSLESTSSRSNTSDQHNITTSHELVEAELDENNEGFPYNLP